MTTASAGSWCGTIGMTRPVGNGGTWWSRRSTTAESSTRASRRWMPRSGNVEPRVNGSRGPSTPRASFVNPVPTDWRRTGTCSAGRWSTASTPGRGWMRWNWRGAWPCCRVATTPDLAGSAGSVDSFGGGDPEDFEVGERAGWCGDVEAKVPTRPLSRITRLSSVAHHPTDGTCLTPCLGAVPWRRIGEEFLYCVKAAGCAGGGRLPGGHAASGRSRPPPPSRRKPLPTASGPHPKAGDYCSRRAKVQLRLGPTAGGTGAPRRPQV